MPGSVPIGVPSKLVTAIAAPGTSVTFAFQPDPDGGDFSCVFQFIGTGTGLTVNLEISLDGGTTFTSYAVLLTTLAAPQTKTALIVSGGVYRLNFTAVAGGTTDVWVSSN